MNMKTLTASMAALAGALWLSLADAATVVTQQLEPASIALGGTARLTISASGSTAITPPMVPGLEFDAVAQSQRVESVNGVTPLDQRGDLSGQCEPARRLHHSE